MKELSEELQNTKEELVKVITSIAEENINTVPFKDSWTASQITEHVLKAIGTDVLYGNTTKTDRKPDEKVAGLKNIFLDFSIKMKSPDFILPSGVFHTKSDLINNIDNTWAKLTEAAEKLDLAPTCTNFEFPGFGQLTRLELVSFYIMHTQRHTHQLKNIAKVFAEKVPGK